MAKIWVYNQDVKHAVMESPVANRSLYLGFVTNRLNDDFTQLAGLMATKWLQDEFCISSRELDSDIRTLMYRIQGDIFRFIREQETSLRVFSK